MGSQENFFPISLPLASSDSAAETQSFPDGKTGWWLQNEPGNETFDWVTYNIGFDPANVLLGVKVECYTMLEFDEFDPAGVDDFFIGLSNFQTGRWDIHGPFNANGSAPLVVTQPLDNAIHHDSADGQGFVAIIAAPGGNVSLTDLKFITHVNDAPVAQLIGDVTQQDAPVMVNFDAGGSSDDGQIVTYEWDLNGDGVFESDTGEVSTNSSTFVSGGVFDCAVRVTDDEGLTGTDEFTVTVTVEGNVPPNAVLSTEDPTEGNGEDGFNVDFESADSDDPDGSIALFEWDLDGDGSFEVNSTSPDVQTFAYNNPGEFKARLRVTDDGGLSDTATVLVLAHGWARVPVADIANGGPAAGFCLTKVGKFPAISYRDADLGKVFYARASTEFGTEPLDWELTELFDAEEARTSLLAVDRNPAICFQDQDGLQYARSLSARGNAISDWEKVLVDNVAGRGPCLAIIGGNPAVSYVDPAATQPKYAFSSTKQGSSESDWTAIPVAESLQFIGGSTGLQIVGGNPAIAWVQQTPAFAATFATYSRSSTPDGHDPDDWGEAVEVSPGGSIGSTTQLGFAVVGGAPALAFAASSGAGVKYAIAPESFGLELADWTVVDADLTGFRGLRSSLKVIAGKPALLYDDTIDPNSLVLAESSSETGSSLTDWSSKDIVATDPQVGDDIQNDLADISGRPATVFYDPAANQVVYAVRF